MFPPWQSSEFPIKWLPNFHPPLTFIPTHPSSHFYCHVGSMLGYRSLAWVFPILSLLHLWAVLPSPFLSFPMYTSFSLPEYQGVCRWICHMLYIDHFGYTELPIHARRWLFCFVLFSVIIDCLKYLTTTIETFHKCCFQCRIVLWVRT